MRTLTEKQRVFAEENHRLIYGFLSKYRLQCEEWYGTAAVGYCKAVIEYEPERKAAFSTYAYCKMLNEVRGEMRKARARKRRASLLSLQSEVDDGLTIEDTLGYEQSFDEAEDGEKILDRLDMRQRTIVELRAEGAKQYEIAAKMGMTQGRVSKELKIIRAKYVDERAKNGQI